MKLFKKSLEIPEEKAKPSVTKEEIVAAAKAKLEAEGEMYLEEMVDHLRSEFPGVMTRSAWANKVRQWYAIYRPAPVEEE